MVATHEIIYSLFMLILMETDFSSAFIRPATTVIEKLYSQNNVNILK